MQILFVRHGQSTANTLKVFANRRVDDHPLTPLGRRQAHELACQLASEPVSHVYTSPLLRAHQTAATVATARSLPLEVTAALREYDVGELEGHPYAGVDAWRMAEYEQNEARWRQGDADHRLAGGESLSELRVRLHRFVRDLGMRHGLTETVLLVGHGGLFRVALPGLLENVTPDVSHGHPMDHGTIVRATLIEGRLACTQWGELRFGAAAQCGG
jgi:broad specificity phosphatase PhoE